MTLNEIKKAVLQGDTVHWSSQAYTVIVDNKNQWMIKCTLNNYCIGLTWADDVTMNGKESDFFIGEQTN